MCFSQTQAECQRDVKRDEQLTRTILCKHLTFALGRIECLSQIDSQPGDRQTNRKTDGSKRWLLSLADRQTNRQTTSQTASLTDGWMDGQTGGQIDRQTRQKRETEKETNGMTEKKTTIEMVKQTDKETNGYKKTDEQKH
jgi:hypothetical protein